MSHRRKRYDYPPSKIAVPESSTFALYRNRSHFPDLQDYWDEHAISPKDTILQPFENKSLRYSRLNHFSNYSNNLFERSVASRRDFDPPPRTYSTFSPNTRKKNLYSLPDDEKELHTRSLGDLRSSLWDEDSPPPFYALHRRLSERIEKRRGSKSKSKHKSKKEDFTRENFLSPLHLSTSRYGKETSSHKKSSSKKKIEKSKSPKHRSSEKKYDVDVIVEEKRKISIPIIKVVNPSELSSATSSRSDKKISTSHNKYVKMKTVEPESSGSTQPSEIIKNGDKSYTKSEMPSGSKKEVASSSKKEMLPGTKKEIMSGSKTEMATGSKKEIPSSSKKEEDEKQKKPADSDNGSPGLFSFFKKNEQSPNKESDKNLLPMGPSPSAAVLSLAAAAISPPTLSSQKYTGEVTIAQKLIPLCKSGEWNLVEAQLRSLEKANTLNEQTHTPKCLLEMTDEDLGWTPLMYTIKENKIAIADRMIQLGCDVNARNKKSHTALHLAALEGGEDMVRFLVENGADTTLTTEKKENPLHLVCSREEEGISNVVHCLLKVCPDNARLDVDSERNIPLFQAIGAGNANACHRLLQSLTEQQLNYKGGHSQDSALHLAVIQKKYEIARMMLDKGANVNATNSDLQTPLHIACAQGDERFVKWFFIFKADPNVHDKYDRSPINLAVMNGKTEILDILVEKFKVSVFERDKDGSTLVHIASLHGHPETAMALFKRGVPLQMPNKGGARSLHIAAKYGHSTMINRLMEKGEDVDALTIDNYTALHIAVENERPNVVETLLGYGAQVHIKGGKAQETALHIAGRTANGEKCAQMLLKSGADPHLTMDNGETPLHIAARHGKLGTTKLLLQDAANAAYRSKDGLTPLHLACQNGHLDVVKELLNGIRKVKGDSDVTLYINTVTNKGESSLHFAAKLPRSLAVVAHSVAEITSSSAMMGIAALAALNRNKDATGVGREIARVLLDNGASVYLQTRDTKETPFHYCAWGGNNHILLEMLSRMSHSKIQRVVNKPSINGWSPLLTSCHRGHRDVVKTLLENHARVDIFDAEGHSALHLAAEAGYQDICENLLAKGAFINAKSRVGRTALHLAAEKGFTQLCEFLIKDCGAIVDIVTLEKQTPLHLAAKSGKLDVCRLLMKLKADPDASDEQGQKPIHLAAENNHSEVIELFLNIHSPLVSSSTKDGSTSAHLAAQQGSVSVLKELMKFDKSGVISARNKISDATALQIAAEGGHAELVKSLLDAGANAIDENRDGYTAVHLAAKNGHTHVIEAFRNSSAISLCSQKMGLTALHIAAFYGQQVTARELLQYIPATTPSEAPISVAKSFIKECGTESGFTPLHMAAYSGEESVVRLLLNSRGVQTDATTTNFGFNPLHLAARGGHLTVVGLLLSRSSELLESKDETGKTSLHIAAIHGHTQMCEFLLGQGAEIDAVDMEKMTSLHCAAKAGHLGVVKLLSERGASPLAKNNKGYSPIWFADVENHIPVLSHLMEQEHDTYTLMEDHEFVFNLTICGKKSNNEPLNEFVLVSPAPVDVAAKLAKTLLIVSTKEKERAKDLIAASKHCESMAAELLVLAASTAESAGKILNATDGQGIKLLDVLIDNEQKEVVAHTVVQRYLHEVWVGNLTWASWKLMLLFCSFILLPPVWIIFSLPIGHKYYKIPIVKFMSYLTSHIHLMILLCLICVTPIYPVLPIRQNLFPFSFEWIFIVYILGLVVSEVTSPSDKSGLGWIKVAVLFCSLLAVAIHGAGFFIDKAWYGNLLYIRNQMFALAILLATVQILDFLSFHYLFGPWTIIIGNLMKDLARFLAVLAIFMLGFSLVMSTLNLPVFSRPEGVPVLHNLTLTNGLPSGVLVTPVDAFELLFFGLFGQTEAMGMRIEQAQPGWTLILFKIFFAVFMLVTVVVLINLLIAMMSDTYQRIVAQSDIEWKYGLAKLICNYHRTVATPTPINLFSEWIIWIINKWRYRKNPLDRKRTTPARAPPKIVIPVAFNKLPPKERWKDLYRRIPLASRVAKPRLSINLAQLSTLAREGINSNLEQLERIEDVTDWPLVAQKYRSLVDRK